MLCLGRKPEETIVVQTSDGPVTFKVCGVRGQQVKVGVEAPKACDIKRGELLCQTPESPQRSATATRSSSSTRTHGGQGGN